MASIPTNTPAPTPPPSHPHSEPTTLPTSPNRASTASTNTLHPPNPRPSGRPINPFTAPSNWETLGFEDPHAFPKRDASFVPAGGRGERVPTPPTLTSTQHVKAVQAAWRGSGVFDGRHEALAGGGGGFDFQVDGRRRETYLLGYGKENVQSLKLGGEFGAGGASRRDRRRGHGRFKSSFY